ncbi:MAG: 1,4-alpha-glucan branching protein domain-containing protein [Betaproteobacteria bacterium]
MADPAVYARRAGRGTLSRAQKMATEVHREARLSPDPPAGDAGPRGSLVFVFHSHIPYCRKAGMWPFGEEWLYEAMLESYIPLLKLLWTIPREPSVAAQGCGPGMAGPGAAELSTAPRRAPVGVTLGITPVLLDQLDDDYMREGFLRWAEARLARAENDRGRFRLAGDRARERQAAAYCERYGRAINAFRSEYACDIAGAFGELQERGVVEIITSAATHAYLPLLREDTSIRAQLAAGCESYTRRFGRAPRGIWLPECAYRPGLEDYLQALGLEYFFVDRHAVEGGEPIGIASGQQRLKDGGAGARAGGGATTGAAPGAVGSEAARPEGGKLGRTTFKPYLVSGSRVACFGRNERVTTQVWSSWLGYPGDGVYREFHKKDDVSGLQYWRVTSRDTDLGAKEVYDADAASARVREHAAHFVGLVHELVNDWWVKTGEHGVVVAPYDTELFGHWWYEGVEWLGEVLKGLSGSAWLAARSAGQVLDEHPPQEAIDVPESSWGRGGGHDVWFNDGTAWMWEIIHAAEARVKRLAALCEPDGGRSAGRPAGQLEGGGCACPDFLDSIKAQALREFFLLVSSDWPFLVTERQATEYGARRFREHAERFDRLMDYAEEVLEAAGPGGIGAGSGASVEAREEAARYLATVSDLDDPFPWLDFSVLSPK